MKFNEDEIRDLVKQALADVNAGLPADQALETPEERFVEVEQALKELFTDNYREFIDDVMLVAPKPATFRVNLPNGNNLFLKWLGECFEIQIEGKRYRMDYHEQFMQALNHITELFKYGTQKTEGSFDEFGEGGEAGAPGGFGGGGGDFPGDEGPTGDFEDLPGEGGEELGAEPAAEEPDFT